MATRAVYVWQHDEWLPSGSMLIQTTDVPTFTRVDVFGCVLNAPPEQIHWPAPPCPGLDLHTHQPGLCAWKGLPFVHFSAHTEPFVQLKAAEHRTANKTLTGRQKAARREAASVGKVHRDPLRNSRGVVIARYCVEIECTQLTESTGRFCPSCEARLPSRARKYGNPMARVKLEKWEGEKRYWKARLTGVMGSEGG